MLKKGGAVAPTAPPLDTSLAHSKVTLASV